MVACPECGEILRQPPRTTAFHCKSCDQQWATDLKGGLRRC
jgi:tRNA(Ile2) C34 agmatinyltransferase TiaS